MFVHRIFLNIHVYVTDNMINWRLYIITSDLQAIIAGLIKFAGGHIIRQDNCLLGNTSKCWKIPIVRQQCASLRTEILLTSAHFRILKFICEKS